MNTKQFQYVLTLAHEGSFSKAADSLNISQPSLSQYIKKIEKEVGLELFDRTNGDVRITDAGEIYIETARQILDLEHQMENALSDLTDNKTGSLIIGTAPYRAVGMMPIIAAALKKTHPGIHLIVREGTTAELIEAMEHGEYDLALTLLPINGRLFQWEKIMEEELILAVPGTNDPLPSVLLPEHKFPAVNAEILSGQDLVMLTETQFMQKQLRNLLFDQKITVRTAAVVKSLEAQIKMVKAGIGMALMPSGIEHFCHDGSVRYYSFVDPLPRREVALVWRRDRKLPKIAEELRGAICSITW